MKILSNIWSTRVFEADQRRAMDANRRLVIDLLTGLFMVLMRCQCYYNKRRCARRLAFFACFDFSAARSICPF